MKKKNKNKEGKKKKAVKKKTKVVRSAAKKTRKKSVSKKSLISRIKIRTSQKKASKTRGGMTLRGIELQKLTTKKIQNLVSALVIVSGLFIGSLFVDVAQFVTGNGYSERALREADVFELGDKTWVAFKEPAIQVDVLTTDDEDCFACDADDVLVWMKKFIPTIVVNKVSENSPEGERLIERYGLKTVPSFVFEKEIREASFFQEEEVQEIFTEKNDGLVLNSSVLGIPTGKYIEVPGELEGDIVIGKKDAKIKLVTFIDFQCPYCKIFYEVAKEARNEFSSEELALVYKHFPLDLHGQAISAALAGQCAYEQGRFEEMADLLFANQPTWGVSEDFKIFDQYALRIGLNKKEFDECVNSEESQGLVQASIDQGDQFGIAGTPASFIGNEFLNGIFQKEGIVETVKSKLGQ